MSTNPPNYKNIAVDFEKGKTTMITYNGSSFEYNP